MLFTALWQIFQIFKNSFIVNFKINQYESLRRIVLASLRKLFLICHFLTEDLFDKNTDKITWWEWGRWVLREDVGFESSPYKQNGDCVLKAKMTKIRSFLINHLGKCAWLRTFNEWRYSYCSLCSWLWQCWEYSQAFPKLYKKSSKGYRTQFETILQTCICV